MPTGVPMPFNQEIAAQIVALTAEGKPMPAVARALGISDGLIAKWRRLQPLFKQVMDAAREEGADAIIDRYQDQLDNGELEPHMARVQGDFVKWLASCRNRNYRPAQQIEVTTGDIGGDLIEARKRTMLPILHQAQALDAQDVDYVSIPASPTADNESAALPKGCINPFD
jgi:hypothetical protein